jgi:hypothetical protein
VIESTRMILAAAGLELPPVTEPGALLTALSHLNKHEVGRVLMQQVHVIQTNETRISQATSWLMDKLGDVTRQVEAGQVTFAQVAGNATELELALARRKAAMETLAALVPAYHA